MISIYTIKNNTKLRLSASVDIMAMTCEHSDGSLKDSYQCFRPYSKRNIQVINQSQYQSSLCFHTEVRH